MLSITKINSSSNQAKSGKSGKGYAHYLGGPTSTTKQRGDFDDYARAGSAGPLPFWTGAAAPMLGLDGAAQAEHVDRLARGFHPITGEPLVAGAGPAHVMGLDMTFSAPKDVSIIFAGADAETRDAIAETVRDAARAALSYAQSRAVVRRGHGGKFKSLARAALAACYQHFSSRAGEPQLHVHSFFFNVGAGGSDESWSALEHRAQFENKMATGILFRVELAIRMRALGFDVQPDGPYFTIGGIDQDQRDALSSRSKGIEDYLKKNGGPSSAAAKEIAALNIRSSKAEPPLPELLTNFQTMAADIGITPDSVREMRAGPIVAPEEFAIDHDEVLDALTESQSCATAREALAAICERAMGQWDAARCLEELAIFMKHASVVKLGRSDLLEDIFTSKATRDMEARINASVAQGAADPKHQAPRHLVQREFDALEVELSEKLGATVSLAQQRSAAEHVVCDTGAHAFVEGWAGTGKTTMMKAVGSAYAAAGFEVTGCCQSAAASLNLARETGIPSRTIASLLIALRNGKTKLGPRSILVLDEAGMVGSREFELLQKAAMEAGAKFVAVGDPKQLQPIEAGGIFRALTERHGKAEISNIQRQRTDFEPMLRWMVERGDIDKARAKVFMKLPDDARIEAMEALCSKDAKLSRGFERWRARYDHEWLRGAVRQFAKGEAREALAAIDERGRLRLEANHEAALSSLISDWLADKASLTHKAMIAGTRAEVAELNARAREALTARGAVLDAQGLDIDVVDRDGGRETKRFAPGDRIIFTKNDKGLGVSNGVAGSIAAIEQASFVKLLRVELDEPNALGETTVMIPTSFGRFDLGYCLTNHKSQGRTFDSAYILTNPAMADREWTYVAASRSRFSTTLYVDRSAIAPTDPESHQAPGAEPAREALVASLAFRMSRSRAKGTTLDYEQQEPVARAGTNSSTKRAQGASPAKLTVSAAAKFLTGLARRARSAARPQRESERGGPHR